MTVGSVTQAYNSIYMAQARPTLTFNSISLGADAALSADPDSFEESKFEGNALNDPLNPLYTADYDRVGPMMWGNTLTNNTTNGIFVRVQDQPGGPVQKLDVPARFSDSDIVYVISGNLLINGNPGGPLYVFGTCALMDAGPQKIGAWTVPRSPTVVISRCLTVLRRGHSSSSTRLRMQSLPLVPGRIAINYSSFSGKAADIALEVSAAITGSGLFASGAVTTTGNFVEINAIKPATVTFNGLSRIETRSNGRLAIDPGVIVKLEGSRIEAEIGSQFIAEGTPTNPIIFTSLQDNTYGAGGTFATADDPSTVGQPGDWAGLYFGPASTASIDNAKIYFGGGQAPIEGGYANFDVIEARQAQLRRQQHACSKTMPRSTDTTDRNGRGCRNPGHDLRARRSP